MSRVRTVWSWIWTLTLALSVVGALSLLDPGREESESVTSASVGSWAETKHVRFRIDKVERAPGMIDPFTDERIELPAAELLIFTVDLEWMLEQEYLGDRASLRIGGDTYTPSTDQMVLPAFDPGYVVTGQIAFWVPSGRADSGTFVVHGTDSMYSGINREAIHVSWSDPTAIPIAALDEATVTPA